jgi:hypothetical protein
MPMYPCGRKRASREKAIRGRKARMRVRDFMAGNLRASGR